MFLNNVGSVIASRARNVVKIVTLAAGVTSGVSGCATHASQATHIAPQVAHVSQADRFTRDVNHIQQNLELIKNSGMLNKQQFDDLLGVPSSHPAELTQAVASGAVGLRGCQEADSICADNAKQVCKGFEEDIDKCPEYHVRCDGVLEKCASIINQYVTFVTVSLRREAMEAAEAANAAQNAAK